MLTATAISTCTYQHTCPYCNNSVTLPLIAWETLVNAYCHKNMQKCARFLVYSELGGGPMPTDLRPDQISRAHDILSCSFYGT